MSAPTPDVERLAADLDALLQRYSRSMDRAQRLRLAAALHLLELDQDRRFRRCRVDRAALRSADYTSPNGGDR